MPSANSMNTGDDAPQLMYPAPLAPERGNGIHTNGASTIDIETPILVVGGGPVGMLQALMFARLHGHACTLIEREATTTTYPKMEYTNGRSMEIYRLMGLHEDLRAMATKEVPEHYANNEIIVTSLAEGGKLIATWDRESAEDQRKRSHAVNDGSQYLEPHLRCHQILIERWLKEKVEAEKLIQSHWATSFFDHQEHNDHVLSHCKKADGTTLNIKSQYVIGCDGGGSWVRKCAGLESTREYLNMTMAFVHFRSTALRKQMPFPRFWHGNVIGGGILVTQNEDDLWTCHFMVPPGVDATQIPTDEILAQTIGGCQGPVPVVYDEVFCRGVWRVDVAIANKFRSDGGRVFIAGDAAHQLSPVGGHGLNSGLGDAFDLAWKLSAKINGWAGDRLLDTYDKERRQIAFENLDHVQKGLSTIVVPILASHVKHGPEVINGEGAGSEKIRAELAAESKHGEWLHDQNGNILGYQYKDSPGLVVEQETGKRPEGTDQLYVPTTYPGSQAPHVWMKNGSSTIDQLSPKAFNMVDFSTDRETSKSFVDAANELNVPLQVLHWAGEHHVGKIYQRDLVLIRPDTHVAWRSSDGSSNLVSKEEAITILRTACGRNL